MPTLYPDRVITIRGSQDNVSEAENAISGKLRECYEKEMNMPLVSLNFMFEMLRSLHNIMLVSISCIVLVFKVVSRLGPSYLSLLLE